jgi:hypothetical protein
MTAVSASEVGRVSSVYISIKILVSLSVYTLEVYSDLKFYEGVAQLSRALVVNTL